MSDAPALAVRRLRPEAVLPAYQSPGAAGLDLHACLDAPVSIAPGTIEIIPIGISLAIPDGYEGQVRPRSGLGSRHGLTLPNAPGTIDSDYRGELSVPLINHGRATFVVEPGMRVAQMVIAPVARCAVVEVETLDTTARGAAGFGSTGVH